MCFQKFAEAVSDVTGLRLSGSVRAPGAVVFCYNRPDPFPGWMS